MLLRPVVLDESVIGQPLPWALYNAFGVLILPAGSEVADAAHLRKLLGRPLFRPADHQANGGSPGRTLSDLIGYLDALYDSPAEATDLDAGLRQAAMTLKSLHHADADAALGLTRLLGCSSRATRHCVHTAQLSLGLGELMSFDEPALDILAAAALSMNIAAMKLHNELIDRNQPSREEKQAIRSHPALAARLLRDGGVNDRVWLDTVSQHHENMDGTGYPERLRGNDIGLPARILRVADLYSAKITGRYYRPPRSSLFAMQNMFGDERRKIDTQVAALLLRRYGFFPPGTLVQLANRETAVVTRTRERNNALRYVVSVLDSRARPLETPAERDTQKSAYAVTRLADMQINRPDIRWEAAWGYT